MKNLSIEDTDQASAGIWPFLIGSVVSLTGYAINKHRHQEEITVPGAATAMCFGAVTGGGIVGNLVWRPGFAAINAAGQAIAAEQ